MRREGSAPIEIPTSWNNPGLRESKEVGPATSTQTELPWVLVVEDNRLNSELVKIYLKNICRMDFARSGEEALDLAAKNQYALVIMDINLGPGIDGIQTTRELRLFNGYTDVPVIAVTGYTMPEDIEQIKSGGCSHYISKPIDKTSFTKLISGLLEKL
jgi:CheY-like chemotaxis protein